VRGELAEAARELEDRLATLVDAVEPLTGVQVAVVKQCTPVPRAGHDVDLAASPRPGGRGVAAVSALGVEPLGSVRTESMQGWRARWTDLASRTRRLAARAVDVVALAVIAAVIGLPAVAAGLAWQWTALAAGAGVLLYEPVAALRGGSAGKRLLGIEAISVWDCRALGRADALRRALFVDVELLLPPLAVRSVGWLLGDPPAVRETAEHARAAARVAHAAPSEGLTAEDGDHSGGRMATVMAAPAEQGIGQGTVASMGKRYVSGPSSGKPRPGRMVLPGA
jgi:hypothetical protein